jgi:hypothetical protein
MKNSIALFFSIAFLFCYTSDAFGQTVKEVIHKMKTVYENDEFQINSTYYVYKGHHADKPFSQYKGIYCKLKGVVYQKAGELEVLSNKDFTLSISNENKQMTLNPPSSLEFNNLDLDKILGFCEKTSIETDETYYKIILKFPSNTDLPFSAVYLHINKLNFELYKMNIFYSYQKDFAEIFSEVDMEFPRLRIVYEPLSGKVDSKQEFLNVNNYLLIKNNSITPTGDYINYELNDLRK